jgi:hypothetical protein
MGPVSIPPFAPRYGSDPELVVLDQVLPKGEGADEWHSDNTFMAEPPMGSILKAVQLPTYGGDTCFASMVAAYDGLSSAMKRLPPRENDVLLRFLIGVPVPLPLGPPFDRVLGQPLGAALRGARLRGAPRDAPRHAGARASDGSARQLKEATVKPSSVSAGVSTRAGACAETTGRRSPGTGRQPEGESLRQRTTWGSATNTALASAPAR